MNEASDSGGIDTLGVTSVRECSSVSCGGSIIVGGAGVGVGSFLSTSSLSSFSSAIR